MSITLINFIALLNIKFALANSQFELPLRCKSAYKLVDLLYKNNYIISYRIIEQKKSSMFNNTSRVVVIDYDVRFRLKFVLVSKPTRVISKSFNAIKKVAQIITHRRLIVSTNKGLLIGEDCVKCGIGGIVVCSFTLIGNSLLSIDKQQLP